MKCILCQQTLLFEPKLLLLYSFLYFFFFTFEYEYYENFVINFPLFSLFFLVSLFVSFSFFLYNFILLKGGGNDLNVPNIYLFEIEFFTVVAILKKVKMPVHSYFYPLISPCLLNIISTYWSTSNKWRKTHILSSLVNKIFPFLISQQIGYFFVCICKSDPWPDNNKFVSAIFV